MPLTEKGETIKGAMQEQYGEKKGESVFYASKNKGTIEGVDQSSVQPSVTATAPSGMNSGIRSEDPPSWAMDCGPGISVAEQAKLAGRK